MARVQTAPARPVAPPAPAPGAAQSSALQRAHEKADADPEICKLRDRAADLSRRYRDTGVQAEQADARAKKAAEQFRAALVEGGDAAKWEAERDEQAALSAKLSDRARELSEALTLVEAEHQRTRQAFVGAECLAAVPAAHESWVDAVRDVVAIRRRHVEELEAAGQRRRAAATAYGQLLTATGSGLSSLTLPEWGIETDGSVVGEVVTARGADGADAVGDLLERVRRSVTRVTSNVPPLGW
jgi:hypothetical protein